VSQSLGFVDEKNGWVRLVQKEDIQSQDEHHVYTSHLFSRISIS
jgi:hypothetical protein